MKLMVLALDYDGTLADERGLGTEVRRALIEARRRQVLVILCTGRRLDDLARHARVFDLFDAIVAENGALLHFPRTGRSTLLATPPDPRFAAELERRGIPHAPGECVVELDGALASRVLEVVRDLELPLILAFNRGRLMVLPQSVSKSTGLCEAARALRVSLHNALALGDAENDHDLLRVCEHGVAVGWGSPALQRVADEICPGTGPQDVAPFVRRWLDAGQLPAKLDGRHLLQLGQRADGSPLSLAVLGRNVLIAGDAQSGKSWVAGLLCEQLVLQRYSVCVIDPEGDYATLEELPGVMVLSANPRPPPIEVVERALRFSDVSVVVDLTGVPLDEQRVYVPPLLRRLAAVRRMTGLPHRIVLDEAHYFLNETSCPQVVECGLHGFTLVTFRVGELAPAVLAATQTVVVTHESDRSESAELWRRYGSAHPVGRWTQALESLELDEAALLPGVSESGGELVRFRIARRLTSHVRHKHKYLTVPVTGERAFVFRHHGAETGERAESLHELLAALSAAPEQVFEHHLQNGDFSRWIGDVFGDHVLAERVREVESGWRRHLVERPHDRIVRAILQRYASLAHPPIATGAELPAETAAQSVHSP